MSVAHCSSRKHCKTTCLSQYPGSIRKGHGASDLADMFDLEGTSVKRAYGRRYARYLLRTFNAGHHRPLQSRPTWRAGGRLLAIELRLTSMKH